MSNTIGYYVLDLGALLKQEALDAKARAVAATGSSDHQFELGRVFGYYEVLSLMKQQAETFGIPLTALSLEGFNPDSIIAPT